MIPPGPIIQAVLEMVRMSIASFINRKTTQLLSGNMAHAEDPEPLRRGICLLKEAGN